MSIMRRFCKVFVVVSLMHLCLHQVHRSFVLSFLNIHCTNIFGVKYGLSKPNSHAFLIHCMTILVSKKSASGFSVHCSVMILLKTFVNVSPQ